jgi:hypothetical protein
MDKRAVCPKCGTAGCLEDAELTAEWEALEGELIPPGERRDEIPYPDCPGPPSPPSPRPRTRPGAPRGELLKAMQGGPK